MPTAHLDGRALITVAGEDAEHFVQNIVTTDLATVGSGEARPGALLAPQGKILFDFLVSRLPEGVLRLECRADVAGDFFRRLMLYRLRAKAEISKPAESVVAVSWDADSTTQAASGTVRDLRFPASARVWRHYADLPDPDASPADWHAFRIGQGVAESGDDYALGEAFPHDVLLDQTGGVGFRKGCYVGQEVVSRMQHRGTARRRILIARGDAPLPPPGTPVTAGGRPIGALGSVSGRDGLALVRIDRAKAAADAGLPVAAGEVELALSIPPWAGFGFPEGAAEAADADG